MKELIIIGGGIAGLSTGIYAQKNGFKTTIYEQHKIVGGECTGWNRKGHHIDGCIHWLTGIKEDTDLNKIWRTVGALVNVEIKKSSEFSRYYFDDTEIVLTSNLAELESNLIKISPEDTHEIKNFIKNIEILKVMNIPADKPMDLMSPLEAMRFMWSMKEIGKTISATSKIDCFEYGKKFKHIAIQKLFENAMPKGFSLFFFLSTLANYANGNCGYPVGGSYELSMRMKAKYLSLGGTIKTSSKVDEIIIENNTAKGIILKKEKIFADYVVATCDPNITFTKLLKNKYTDVHFKKRYDNPKDYPVFSIVYTSFSVDLDLKNYPKAVVFKSRKYLAGTQTVDVCGFKNYAHEPNFAPAQKTTIVCAINQYEEDYLFWKELSKDQKKYIAEKNRLANDIIMAIEERYPELQNKISILDIATPLTYERYCSGYKGAYMAFAPTKNAKNLSHNGKIKGLKNFLLAGQWLQPPGGLPIAVISGKFTVQRICRLEKLKFNG
ncbi:MAG: phytoene desaturase family protein [Sarcina sp.]